MSKYFSSFFPKVKADDAEDVVDPQAVLREKCAKEDKAQKLWEVYQVCNDRVNSRKKTAEQCSEELCDYLHVLDHCVTKTLFTKLK